MSASAMPVNALGLPSYCAWNAVWVGLPSASAPSEVYLTPFAPRASIFSVWLLGAGPGLYLDLARLSFHVPILLSAARTPVPKASNEIPATANAKTDSLFMMAPGAHLRPQRVDSKHVDRTGRILHL